MEYLGNGKDDPRKALIQELIKQAGSRGDILVYNIGFERSVLTELAKDFPAYAEGIESLISRLKDLMVPFSKKYYYTPSMRGSYSIKVVLPALVPNLSYAGLGIGNGEVAMNAYESLHYEEDRERVEQVRKDVLAYCRLDTLAMVDILGVLEGV